MKTIIKQKKKNRKRVHKKAMALITSAIIILTGIIIVALPTKAAFESGIATINPVQDVKPGTNDTWTITYTIGKYGICGNRTNKDCTIGIDGGVINITIPFNWSIPQITDPTEEGFVVVRAQYCSSIVLGEISITGRNISIPVISGSNKGERIHIIYGEMSGGIGPGAKAQSFVQHGVEFEVWENPDINSDDWRKLIPSPKINVLDHVEGITGITNITTCQAIGVQWITFGKWLEQDDTAMGVVSKDGFSYQIGLQLNNGDLYGGTNQEIYITLFSYAKTVMVVKLTTEFSITKPDQADAALDDIHIWYTADKNNVIGQIDPWTYFIEIPAMEAGSNPATVTFKMWVNVGNIVEPGFYLFNTYIEPTNWEGIHTVNMG